LCPRVLLAPREDFAVVLSDLFVFYCMSIGNKIILKIVAMKICLKRPSKHLLNPRSTLRVLGLGGLSGPN
jgi:hypothetical protein